MEKKREESNRVRARLERKRANRNRRADSMQLDHELPDGVGRLGRGSDGAARGHTSI